MVAQIYQWITLEINRIQYKNDKHSFKKRLEEVTKAADELELTMSGEEPLIKMDPDSNVKKTCRTRTREKIEKNYSTPSKVPT